METKPKKKAEKAEKLIKVKTSTRNGLKIEAAQRQESMGDYIDYLRSKNKVKK